MSIQTTADSLTCINIIIQSLPTFTLRPTSFSLFISRDDCMTAKTFSVTQQFIPQLSPQFSNSSLRSFSSLNLKPESIFSQIYSPHFTSLPSITCLIVVLYGNGEDLDLGHFYSKDFGIMSFSQCNRYIFALFFCPTFPDYI